MCEIIGNQILQVGYSVLPKTRSLMLAQLLTASASSSVVKSHNPWGGMINNGMKQGVNSETDAEIHLKYLDGTAYTNIPGIKLLFNDVEGPNPFRIMENGNGELELSDADASYSYDVLCQYACQGKLSQLSVHECVAQRLRDCLVHTSLYFHFSTPCLY